MDLAKKFCSNILEQGVGLLHHGVGPASGGPRVPHMGTWFAAFPILPGTVPILDIMCS